MSLADVTSARSSPSPDGCPDCDTSASVTSDLHKYQVACTCKPGSVQYACADDPGPPPPAKTDTPPALPPRPPNSLLATNRRNNSSVTCTAEPCRGRKYAWWCVGCGALAAALGGLLAAQHILLRAYTASPHHLETVPAAVPAAMLVLTGVCIMSLARRRNRYSYMIKLVGACCLACALTCVLVTITTTVIHMNKLQTLKFCEFTKLTKTCTCFSMPPDSQHADDEGVRCVFEGVTDCSVVHGALYWCLRGVFALSVSAVLVCIFTCMLAYQLLSHERKKMYWEQLELRCRSLYRPPTGQTAQTTRPPQSTCSCCAQCHPPEPGWDISLQHRFWAPGRIGNLYSPNPGTGRKTSAWSWFPWPRSNSQNSRCRMNVPQSGDSAYGFCDESSPNPNPNTYDERPYPTNYPQPYPRTTTATINPSLPTLQSTLLQNTATFPSNTSYPSNSGSYPPNSGSYPPNSGSYPPNSGSFPPNAQLGYGQEFGEASGSFDAQTGVWGPPPPYSPQGRSGSRHHLHHPDPATASLLHHHHMDPRHSLNDHSILQPHTCRNSYMLQQLPDSHINSELARINPELAKLNPELVRLHPELAKLNPELVRLNPELVRLTPELMRLHPELVKLNPDLMRMHPELSRLNPEIVRLNPELARLNPEIVRLNPELARLNPEMAHLAQIYPPEELARLQLEMARLGSEGRFSTLRGHLVPYRNCQRSLGLSTGNLRDCRLDDPLPMDCLHQKSASKVSDQSSDSCPKLGKENLGFQNDKNTPVRSSMQDCRGVNQNAESEVYFADVSSCCNVSVKADCCKPNVSLVGTIENHPESTSESDTGSFTLTRSQRPQPQVGSKRRPRQNEKNHEKHLKQQDKIRQDINASLRLTEQQIEQLNNSMRMSERMVERLNERDRLNDSRIERIDSRDHLNERMNDSRNEFERMDRSDRMNESRLSDRLNESRMIERMNESRLSERNREGRFEDRRMSDLNSSSRMEGSPNRRAHVSPLRLRSSPKNLSKEHLRQSSSDSNKGEFSNTTCSNLSPNKEFFVPNNINLSPISPNTEESLISDEERQDKPYANEAESSKCLGPDAQYEKVREEKEGLKTVHNRCCSDTNTMDSGWQSGSEKQVTD